MKKKNILCFFAMLVVVLTFLVKMPFRVDAMAAQTITSPSLKCTTYKCLEKKDGSGLTDYRIGITDLNNTLSMRFLNGDIEEDEKLFVVGINKVKNVEVFKEYLETKSKPYYVNYLVVPYYYCDQIELRFYKQKSDEGSFPIKDENLIGKISEFMPHILDYQRRVGTPLTVYDKDGKIISGRGKIYLSRLTPNFYSLQDTTQTSMAIGTYNKIGRIVLPKGQENLLTEEQKTIPSEYFIPGEHAEEEEYWQNCVYQNAQNFNIYIPDGVTEFKFLIYENNITNNPDDILFQYHVKINR